MVVGVYATVVVTTVVGFFSVLEGFDGFAVPVLDALDR